MKSLQIKEIPDDVHAELESRARRNHSTVSREVVEILSETCVDRLRAIIDELTVLDEADRISSLVRGPGLTIAEIQGAVDEGRN